MIKKIITTTVAAMFLSFGAQAATEGVEYQTLPEAVQFDAPNQVVKIYSINCPFCYKYEQAGIPSEALLPAGSELDDYHISSKPPFGAEKTTALAIAKAIKGEAVYKALKKEYYAQYHDKKVKFKDADSTIQFALNTLGMSRAEFDKQAKDPKVTQLMAKWDKGIEIAKIQGIPAITVNGTYLINTKSIRSMDMLKELIAELSEK